MKVSLPASQLDRDALEIQARYTSVTHRSMEEIPWRQSTVKPNVSRETRPDMVTQKVDRYENTSHAWQALGPVFDRSALRKPSYSSKPISYVSGSSQTKYTPGYAGVVPLVSGELGSTQEPIVKRTEVRRDLPPATGVSRQANISGYSGYVRPGTTKPAHYLKPCTTQSLTHREIPVSSGKTGMRYPRTSPISNLVTLTHPFNPHNKLNPTYAQRV